MAHLAAQACQSIAISRPLSVSQESQIFSNFNVVFSSSSQYHLNFKVGVMEDGRQNGPIGLLMLADFEQEIKLEYILVTPTEISTLVLVLPFPRHRLNSMKHLCRSIYTCSQVITSCIWIPTFHI